MAIFSRDTKSAYTADESYQDGAVAMEVIYGDTHQDQKDMFRLGKQQEFKRNFQFISTLGD